MMINIKMNIAEIMLRNSDANKIIRQWAFITLLAAPMLSARSVEEEEFSCSTCVSTMQSSRLAPEAAIVNPVLGVGGTTGVALVEIYELP